MSPAFSQLLSQLLYGQVELRPAILKSLKFLVDSNNTVIKSSSDPETFRFRITVQEAEENITFLRTQVESWLAVLFNVYGSVTRDSQSMVGDVINSWMSITHEKVGSFHLTIESNVRHFIGNSQRLPESFGIVQNQPSAR